MNVASSVPSSALEKISRKMYRPSSRSTTYPLPRHVRRGNHRQLRQFFFRRMQFQVVDQDRGGHHAGLRREAGAANQRQRRGIVLVLEGRAMVAARQVRRVNRAPPISADGAELSWYSKAALSSPAARMSFSERTLNPRKRMPRTSSSCPST